MPTKLYGLFALPDFEERVPDLGLQREVTEGHQTTFEQGSVFHRA